MFSVQSRQGHSPRYGLTPLFKLASVFWLVCVQAFCALALGSQPLAFEIVLPFDEKPDRVYRDYDIKVVPKASIMMLTFTTEQPVVLTGLTVHLNAKGKWGTLQPDIEEVGNHTYRAICPATAFRDDAGRPFDWADSKTLRLSFWRKDLVIPAKVFWNGFDFATPKTALLTFDESWTTLDCANRLRKSLARAGVQSVITSDIATLDRYDLVAVPYVEKLIPKHVTQLRKYVQGGGKLMMFYQSDPRLAEAMGIRLFPYRAAPSGKLWDAMQVPSKKLLVPAPTNNLMPVEPLDKDNKPFAVWTDGTPACALVSSGAWFSHLPPLPSVEAVEMFEAIVKKLAPRMITSSRIFGVTSDHVNVPRFGRTGVWIDRPYSGVPGGWDACFAEFKRSGLTDVFVNLQTGKRVFFELKGRDVTSRDVPTHKDESLKALLDAGRKHGLKVHAWVICWAADTKSLGMFEKEHSALVIDGIKALVYRGVDGIHLDYVRFPNEGSEAKKSLVTSFVKAAREEVQRMNPKCELSAAVFPTPESALRRGQDWAAWLEEDLLEFVCPMIYSNTTYGFESMVESCVKGVENPAKIMAGIGYSADESQLDAKGMAAQARFAEQSKLGGVAYFTFDGNFVKRMGGE